MKSEDQFERDDDLSERLASFDQTLATGSTKRSSPHSPDDGLDVEESSRLSRAQLTLEMIERVRSNDPSLFSNGESSDKPTTIGRFRIIRELGRGGFGVVLQAHDPNLSRDVALKLPHPDVVLSEELRDRFLQEGMTAASLRHPNIVPVYQAEHVGPICYLVSAYCDGPTLGTWLREQDAPVDPMIAARVVRDIAQAVSHAHQRNVIHRDLKPGNVLLEVAEDGTATPLVTDFGMAKVLAMDSDQTHTTGLIGTPAYMAPEQAAGANDQIGPATDIYALGVILHELLTGARPHNRETPLATLRSIQLDPVTPITEICRSVPQALEAVCLKCLEKEPASRFESADALALALNECLANADAPATRAGRSVGSRRAVLAAGALLVVTAFAAALIWKPALFSTVAKSKDALIGKNGTAKSPNLSQPNTDSSMEGLDRRVADWVLKANGEVTLAYLDGRSMFSQRISLSGNGSSLQVDELPAQPFRLVDIWFSSKQSLRDLPCEDIAALPHLASLVLTNSPITDEQFARLAGANCRSLWFNPTTVTDDALENLSEFPNLERVVFGGLNVTDAWLPHVVALSGINDLSLDATKVTDEGMRHLSDVSQLLNLSLNRNALITNAGLKHLAPLTSLRELDLRRTQVTDRGIEWLQQRLPKCKIVGPCIDVQASFAIVDNGGSLRGVTSRNKDIEFTKTSNLRHVGLAGGPIKIHDIFLWNSDAMTSEQLDTLSRLDNVKTVTLGALQETHAAFVVLSKLKSVQKLSLWDSTISNEDVAKLSQLDHLSKLELRDCEFTDTQLSNLKRALPQVDVSTTARAPTLDR